MTKLIIGENCAITSYHTKQRGYGRQSLFVELERNDIPFDIDKSYIKDVYIRDVYPNILENYQEEACLREYAYYDEDSNTYKRDSGNGEYTEDQIFDTTLELLNAVLKDEELEIEEEEEETE